MRDIKTLYQQRQAIENNRPDISFIPTGRMGLISDENKIKYADVLRESDENFHQLQKFNASLTTAEKKALSKYRRHVTHKCLD